MRNAFIAAFFFSAGIACGSTPKSAISVHVEWINYDELRCEGCRAQTVIMDAGSDFITTHKREGKMIYTKIAGDWIGDAIRVTLTDEGRSDNGAFVDLKGDSAVVGKGETKELKVGEIRFLVSAAKAEDKPTSSGKSVNVPNQLPDPTSPSVTPPAGAGGAPSVAADH